MVQTSRRSLLLIAGAVLASLVTTSAMAAVPKHRAPIPAATLSLMQQQGVTAASPILIRIYKKEAELEVWKRNGAGLYVPLKTFPICRWSGQLGPKTKEGDRQTPEGFYSVTPGKMNPNSKLYLSFDLGYPNAYDRSRGSTGSALMVHGTCSSRGCYAMTDDGMREIYALAREAFAGGQGAIQVHAFPFRMTAENMVRHRNSPHIAFWSQLKEGSDRFEALREEVSVGTANKRYVFLPPSDPAKAQRVYDVMTSEYNRVSALMATNPPAYQVSYADGGQHPIFTALMKRGVDLGDLSRPEALAQAGQESLVAGGLAMFLPKPTLQVAQAPAAPVGFGAALAAAGQEPGAPDVSMQTLLAALGHPNPQAYRPEAAPAPQPATSAGPSLLAPDFSGLGGRREVPQMMAALGGTSEILQPGIVSGVLQPTVTVRVAGKPAPEAPVAVAAPLPVPAASEPVAAEQPAVTAEAIPEPEPPKVRLRRF